jgi:1-acyl-sn-glycerol-3-phosphate acyltransferase
MQRYFAEPYRFVPPYRSPFWCRLVTPLAPTYLRRGMNVRRWQFRGLDRLKQSIADGHGILLTPNHTRWPDAGVMGLLSTRVGRYFHYLLSSHLMRQGRLSSAVLHRLGSFPILREGTDHEALAACRRILTEAERPLVIFPEGTWFRQNDRLGPLQEGVPLIARQAQKTADRPIVIHPVAIKYWLLADPTPALDDWLGRHERRLFWPPRPGRSLVERVERLTSAFLALAEVEVLGAPQTGEVDERIRGLADGIVARLEKRFTDRPRGGLVLERIRWLRQRLVRQLQESAGDRAVARSLAHDLDSLMFTENLNAHSASYLRERPSPERLTETVQRLEETLTDRNEVPAVPLGVVVEVAPALRVSEFPRPKREGRAGGDPLLKAVGATIQGMLDRLLAEGSPWR